MIKQNAVFKSFDILLQLYKSLVRPHLEYCTAASSPYYQKDKKLIAIQRRFTRMVPALREVWYESRLKSLKLWSLEHWRVRANLIEVFNMFQGISIVDISTYFELDSTGCTRGYCLKLKKGRVSTDLWQHFFSERIINIWNRLESSTVESQSLNIFKSKLQLPYYMTRMSFFGQYLSYWLQRPSQSPSEASSGELSGE